MRQSKEPARPKSVADGRRTARFRFASGHIERLHIPPSQSKLDSTFLIGMVKGASTLLDRMSRPLVEFTEKVDFHFPDELFARGIADSALIEDTDRIFQRKGYVFGVFRWLPQSDVFKMERWISKGDVRVLTLLRDPRDALVSGYFSEAFSHIIPESGPLREQMQANRSKLLSTSLDDYVRARAPIVLWNYLRTLQVLAVPTLKLFRYEDIIYDKSALLEALISAMDAESTPEDVRARILQQQDQIPEADRPDDHVRQVHPGDFRRKLSPSTIDELDRTFKPVLSLMSY